MLNAAQIKKLQKQVGTKVDKQIAKREEEIKKKEDEDKLHKQQIFETEILPQLKKIKSSIIHYQKKHSKRKAACFCVWSNKVYHLKDEKATIIHEITKQDLHSDMFEVIGEEDNDGVTPLLYLANDKTYYMMKEELAIREIEINDWLVKNYASIKMVMTKIKKGEKSLVDMSILGGLSIEFTEKFPGKTPYDLIQYIQMFDSFVMDGLKELEKKVK